VSEIRIGITGMSAAGEVDDPYAGVNLAAAENPNFVDEMNHWSRNPYYAGEISAVDTLPMEFTPDPTITTGCQVAISSNGGWDRILQDKVAIPEDMRASLPCDFTASYWSLQVGGVEAPYTDFSPMIFWYDAAGTFISYVYPPLSQSPDVHAWQQDSLTQTIPVTAYFLALAIRYQVQNAFDMYYTATKLERVSPAPPARNLEAFSVSRDSAGILLAVRDNAAPQFAVSRDADGITLGAWR